MPSQDNFLDDLLMDLNQSEKNENDAMDFGGIAMEEPGASIGVDETKMMTQEDIERLLSEANEIVSEEHDTQAGANAEEDIMDMLSQKDDDDLQEIHDLLQKSENNEAIDEDIISMLQNTPNEDVDLFENIMNGEDAAKGEALDERAQRAAERKRERDARKAEKAASREAKKAAKLEAKAQKEAEKKAKKEAKQEAKAEAKKSKEPKQDELADVDELLGVAGSAMQATVSTAPEENVGVIGENSAVAESSVLEDDFFAAFSADEIRQTDVDSQENAGEATDTDSILEKIVEEKRPKKKGIFSKILDLLTEEDEEEDVSKNGNEDIQMSDENKKIIDEMDKGKKKGKKAKKSKKGKDDKEVKEGQSTAEGEAEGEADEDKKEKKPKKEKKFKKEKIPKEIVAEEGERSSRGSKISFKKVLPIALLCLSLCMIIILVANLSGDYSAKKTGREAYYNGDYETCYQNLYGKELNESEQIMYSKSESILRIRLWIREYELFAEEGAEAEALDSLIQSVDGYPALYEYAVQWNAAEEVAESYAQILDILSKEYQLTEDQALEIAAAESDAEYSKMVYAIIDGEKFGSWNQQKEEEPEVLEDVLPEEEELEEVPFVDNNGN